MERQLCDSQDASHPSQTVSRNAAQNASQTILHNVPEANAETGRSLSVPHNIYALQPSGALAQGDSTRPQMSVSSAVSMQQKSPLSTIAGPNNCYLLYLNVADNAQVMMPVAMGVSGIGIKVSNQQPPQTSDARDHQSPDAAGLQSPVSVSPSGVSSVCVQSDEVPACQSQDKCRPPVAVVVPWTSIASSYTNSVSLPADERIPGQDLRNPLTTSSTPSSVMIYQTVNNQSLAVQPRITTSLQNPAQYPALQRNLSHHLALQQSFVHLPSQQGAQLRLAQPGNQQLLAQQQGNQQLLVRPQGSCLQPENRLQPPPQQGVYLQAANRGHPQQLTAPHGGQQPTGGQGNGQQLQQANRQHITSQDGLQQQSNCPPPFIPQDSHQQLAAQQNSLQQLPSHSQQLAFQSGSHQQLLALQLGGSQSLMSHPANQHLALQQAIQQRLTNSNQRLTHSQAVHQRLNIIPALTPAEALKRSLVVQQQLAAQQNNQQMAFLLRNCTQASNPRAMVPAGSPESAKLQLDNGCQMLSLQPGSYRLTELQQRLLQRNCQLPSELPRTPQMLNRPLKLENSCMQLEPQQQQMQQQIQQQIQQRQQLLQQQMQQQQQQQQQSSCLYRTQEGIDTNQAVKEEIKSELSHFHHENRDYKLLSSCVSDAESKCHDTLQSQTVANRNVEMPQSFKEESNSSSKFMDQSHNFGVGGFRFGLSHLTPDTEQVVRNIATQSNRFPSQSVEQLSHLFANRAQFLNANHVQQNSDPKANNFTASSSFGCNIPVQGTVPNEQNQMQPVSVPSCGAAVVSGPHRPNMYNVAKTPDGRNFNINPQPVTNAESPNYSFPQLGPKSVDVHQPNVGDNEQVKNAGDGNTKAGQNKVTALGNGLSSNSYRPSTVVQLRLPQVAGSNYVAATPHVDNAQQLRPVCYSPQVAVSRFSHSRLPSYVLPVQQNSISSSAEPSNSNGPRSYNSPITTATQCVSIPSYQVSTPEANQTSSGVAIVSDGKGQELLAGLPPPRQMGVAKVFINVANPSSGINALSPTDILGETAGKQLEVGQECELRYINGPRLATIWDGKYFKLKRPLYPNQDADQPDVNAIHTASIKGGGGVVPKDGHESASAGSASESRATVNDSVTSLARQETDGCNSLTVSLARPPLHPPTDEQSKPSGSALPAQPGSNSASAAVKRTREEGKFAVCKHCGAFSCDFDRCDQCRRDLPPDVKIYDPVKKQKLDTVSHPPSTSLASINASTKTQSQKTGVQAHGLKRPVLEADVSTLPRTPNAVKVSHSSKKPSAKQHRRQETEVVHILSSDDEEDEDEDPLGSTSKKSANASKSPAKNKTRKSKSESEASSSTAKSAELKPVPNCQLASSDQAASCGALSRFSKFPEPSVLTADVLHVFFGFIRYEKKCFLTLDQTTMALRSVDANDGDSLLIGASEIQMVAGHVNLKQCLTCLFVLVTAEKASELRKLLNRDGTVSFNPDGGEDCAKYVVLFLTEQRSSFLGSVERMISQMRVVCGSDKPYYKQIDTFDVKKYLQNVCPADEIESFTWKSSNRQSNAAVRGTCNDAGEPQRSQENDPDDEDMDYGSRSPSPVHVLFSGQIIKLFTYPPPPATGGITVTNEDLFCLNEGEFLNDVIIDFYLKYLMTEFLSDKVNRTHVFSSFFYRRLTQKPSRRHKEEEDAECTSIQQRRHSRIRTWTRHVDLFEKDFIIVPINESAHWYLAIICYPGLIAPEMAYRTISDDVGNLTSDTSAKNDGKKANEGRGRSRAKHENVEKTGRNDEAPQNTGGRRGRGKGRKAAATPTKPKSEQYVKKMPCILIFDSLAGPGRNGVIRILREYLQVEWDVKKKDLLGQRLFTKDSIKGATPECPQQSNFSDCGIYVLQYVESFFTDPIQDFTFPLKLLGKWFDEEKVKNKRAGLQQLILDMQKRYNPSLDFNPERDGCLIKQDTDETTETAGGTSCQTAPV